MARLPLSAIPRRHGSTPPPFPLFPALLSAPTTRRHNILGFLAFPPVFSRSVVCHVVNVGGGLLETTHFEQ
jgi:hypothetical protein